MVGFMWAPPTIPTHENRPLGATFDQRAFGARAQGPPRTVRVGIPGRARVTAFGSARTARLLAKNCHRSDTYPTRRTSDTAPEPRFRSSGAVGVGGCGGTRSVPIRDVGLFTDECGVSTTRRGVG